MKNALIITGGYINIEKAMNFIKDFSIVIAADSGYSAALKLNIKPQIVLGDFDSLNETNIVCDEILRVPAEKDDTDTMLACKTAIERGATDLLILGGTGGRADHFLANVFFLEELLNQSVKATLTDGENTVRIVKDETVKVKNNNGYFSVFALDECTVTLSGCKYPLESYTLKRTNPFAVSNEVSGETATVKIIGSAILCESKK